MVQEVTDETFADFVQVNTIAIVDCWAAWCTPCRFLSPVIEDLAKEHKNVAFGKLNVDENPATPMRFGVMIIPTLLYFKGGMLIDKTVGALPKGAIEKRLEKILV
ncbi:MAG: thioredoxin [Candidatus Bathyarchaeia archaeon]